MDQVRFVHTHDLHLGSPLLGLGLVPDWLREKATAATRTAFLQAIEVAVQRDAEFLLISGSLVDRKEDFTAAASWLRQQRTKLERHGIRLIAHCDDPSRIRELSRAVDVVVPSGQSLGVNFVDGSRQLQPHVPGQHESDGLSVVFEKESIARPDRADTVYRAIPGSAAHLELMTGTSGLSVAAGALQSLGPAERGPFGCRVVDVDLSTGTILAHFQPTDSIRYETKRLVFDEVSLASDYAAGIVRACRDIKVPHGRTIVVDWLLQAGIRLQSEKVEGFQETDVLKEAQQALHSGHHGVWPRQAVLDSATLGFRAELTPAVRSYLNVVNRPETAAPTPMVDQPIVVTGDRVPEAMTGIALLSRAA